MTPELTVDVFRESDRAWDAALSTLPGRTFCHQAGWADVFQQTFGHETIRLAARDRDGAVTGLLPLVRMRSRIFGHSLISMPFLNYGGPVGTHDARRALAATGVDLAGETGAGFFELRSRQDVDLELPVSREKVTVILPLPEDAATLWEGGLKAKVRSQVRRPMKAGMSAEFGAEHLPAFYDVFCRNMRDLGTPVLPWNLFRSMERAFPDQLVACVVYDGSEPAAGGVGFLFEGEFELTWASSLKRFAREAPNMLLYWSLMEEVIRRGGTSFNFGRCSPGSGTHRFKLQWGGADVQLHWSRWSRAAASAPPSRDKPVMKLATSVWSRLPLPLANRLGPIVSRSLPSW